MNFTFTPLSIPDVILITAKKFGDERGFFMETYRENNFSAAGIPTTFVQENLSLSDKGVLRGLHYQLAPHAQGKLVTVITGSVFDVAVDIRQDSPTYGQHIAVVLSEGSGQSLWVPPGFAHGFVVLTDHTYFSYKVTAYYHPEAERAILWSDPALAIEWPLDAVQLAEKDRQAPCLGA